MDFLKGIRNINILKNHIFRDPLCDWFEIQSYKYNTFQKDPPTKYKEFIINETNKFRKKIMDYICHQLGVPCEYPQLTVSETEMCIQNKESLILNGSLYNKEYRVIVPCDIMIDYETFQGIFPNIQNLPEISSNSYLVINISYSSLHFRKNQKEIMNDELLYYKKCCLYCFQDCLKQYIQTPIHTCIIGKEYYYQKQLLPKHTNIGYVLVTEEMKQSIQKAVIWIQTLIKYHDSMNIYPEPTHNELFPNMNYKDSEWETEKKRLAYLLREITLIWNISYNQRCELLEKDISSWDDPKLLSYLKETTKKHIQERMIHMNQQNEVIIYPRKSISYLFKKSLEKKTNEYFFDVESFLSFEEKQDFIDHRLYSVGPVLGILGVFNNDKYKDFTINSYDRDSERQIIHDWYSYIFHEGDTVYLYHWGNAEKVYLDYIRRVCPELCFEKVHLINVLDYFRKEPILIQGIFSFSLKQIGKVLYKHGLIQTIWTEHDNGLDTMIEFKELCSQHKKQIPFKRISEVQKIIDYNRVDCQVLYEIVEFLRSRYV
jgi:hypothetical protein